MGGPWEVPGGCLGSLGASGGSPEGPWALLGGPRRSREVPEEGPWRSLGGLWGVLGGLRGVSGKLQGGAWGILGGSLAAPGGLRRVPGAILRCFEDLSKSLKNHMFLLYFQPLEGPGVISIPRESS